jgi:K+ transporter
VALAVFSSDPISSTAYATEEILLVLVGAGLAGGAYVVSRDNFGNVTAAVAGAALLIDYVLTVAVSVSSGVAAMASVFPDQLGPIRVEISVAFVLLLMWGNLGGIREAGASSPSPPTCTCSASGR